MGVNPDRQEGISSGQALEDKRASALEDKGVSALEDKRVSSLVKL